MWLNYLLWLTLALYTVYATIILCYRKWFKQLKPFEISADFVPNTSFSIIVPARNEAVNIGHCIESIFSQQYPQQLFEVIVVDDHSTDETSSIVRQYQQQYANLKLIQLKDVVMGQLMNAYKKKAISTAIEQANGDWIVTTDADCVISDLWLAHYAAYIQQYQPVFVAAPVLFINTHSFVSIFQCLDFISLQGITSASVSVGFHSMCNGANLAYSKAAFHAVDGFRDIDTKASGDDMLLMHKIKKQYPKKVGTLFTPFAIVQTHPMPDWKSFFNQRIRWASKATDIKDMRIFFVLLLVYGYNIILLFLPLVAIVKPIAILYWLGLILLKATTELRFMLPAATFFRQQSLLKWFLVMQPVHIFYTVVAGFLGKFGSYQWKGRTVK
jgi:cellulose synthase/poly-beta-1,6-N-acetylglucosamine synthase-like glycosyltransferase